MIAAIRLSLAMVVPESSAVLMADLMLDIEHLFLMWVLYLCLYATKEMLCIAGGDARVMTERYVRSGDYDFLIDSAAGVSRLFMNS